MRQIVLLRGINLGARNRIAMAALRGSFEGAGFGEVRTHLQSGNVVLDSELAPPQLAAAVKELIEASFGLQIAVLARTQGELSDVVARDPLADTASDPKRYLVTFLGGELEADELEHLDSLCAPGEEFRAAGRELFSWHPAGVARSKLWNALAGGKLGATSTSRNWSTVRALLELAS